MTKDDPKTGRLRASGTLNRHPDRIRAERFRNDDFFDPRDLLQVRYEMVRSTGTGTLAEVAAEFGVSVPTCVRVRLHPRSITKALERLKKNSGAGRPEPR